MARRKKGKQLKTRKWGTDPPASAVVTTYDPSIVRPNARPARKRKARKDRATQRVKDVALQDGYGAYLQSAHWLAVKARYRKSNLPQACIVCNDPKYDLHHQTYARLGQEPLTDLAPLCRICHTAVHAYVKRSNIKLKRAATAYRRHALKRVPEGEDRNTRLREYGWIYAGKS